MDMLLSRVILQGSLKVRLKCGKISSVGKDVVVLVRIEGIVDCHNGELEQYIKVYY
jgi:hypothetical protein